MKRKIVVTTGTRAEYGILRPVLRSIQKSNKLELYLIVTGMHLSKKHGMTINEIRKDGFKIFKTIPMIPMSDTGYSMSAALGKGIIAFSDIFHKIKPDINIVLGDRDEMLASAIAAYHMNIPNAHIHGGDKSGGIDEYTRHAITKMSNIHFAASRGSKKRLIRLGENPKYVFFTGSPGIDEVFSNEISKKKELERIYNIKLKGDEILLVYHPVTTESELGGKQIHTILESIIKLGKNIIAIAPNNDAGSRTIHNYLKFYSKKYDFIKLYSSMPRKHFLGMLENCGILVGNSSSGMIEASYFQIPVVNIGKRQEGRERGANVIDVRDITRNSIRNAIVRVMTRKVSKKNINTYGLGDSSKKIVRILEKIRLNKDLIQKKISY
jgi:GDP/UDP-N,N'-diacetylbacillosamine 2-epimerase (hydrolysing)